MYILVDFRWYSDKHFLKLIFPICDLCYQFFIHVNGIHFLLRYYEKVKSEFIPLQKWTYLNRNIKQILTQVVCMYEWEIRFDNLYFFSNSEIVWKKYKTILLPKKKNQNSKKLSC